jgi:plastocyanin
MHRRPPAGLGVAVLLLLAACASGSDSARTADSATTTSGSPSAGIASGEPNPAAPVVVVNVSVRDGKVTPKPHRVDVKLGANVRLQVTSDEDDVLHVHGYEVEEPLEAGHTTTVELTADQPGVFEVETHESELLLLQLAVR